MSGDQQGPRRIRLVAAFAALYFLWGSNFLAIRYAVEAMPPLLMMGVRSLLAGTILFCWAWFARGERPVARQWPAAAVTGALLFLGCHGLLAWAEQTVPSGVAALALATIPVWMALLDWLGGGPRPGRIASVGMAGSLLGLFLLLRPSPVAAPGLGLLALLVGAFCWAAGSILSRRLALPASLTLTSGMQLLVGGSGLVVVGFVLGEAARLGPEALAPRAVLSFAYMVVVASLLCFTTYTWLLRVSTPARVGTYAFVNPVVALFVGWALGGETLDARTLTASLVIVTGVALIVTSHGSPVAARAGLPGSAAAR